MSFKLYNRAFKTGVAFTVLVFGILNISSYFAAKSEHDSSQIKFSSDFEWGFPVSWTWDTGIGLGFALNVAMIAACSFVVGFLFRYFRE